MAILVKRIIMVATKLALMIRAGIISISTFASFFMIVFVFVQGYNNTEQILFKEY
jgi:hypothetical protein